MSNRIYWVDQHVTTFGPSPILINLEWPQIDKLLTSKYTFGSLVRMGIFSETLMFVPLDNLSFNSLWSGDVYMCQWILITIALICKNKMFLFSSIQPSDYQNQMIDSQLDLQGINLNDSLLRKTLTSMCGSKNISARRRQNNLRPSSWTNY